MKQLLLLFFALAAYGQTLLKTTLRYDVEATDIQIQLTSVTGLAVGNLVYIDREAMRINSITGTAVAVQRGVSGTKATGHIGSESVVYAGSSSLFISEDKSGTCTINPNVIYINTVNARRWACNYASVIGRWLSPDRIQNYAFAYLPTAGNANSFVTVSDCLTNACTAGGGSIKAILRDSGSAWETVAGGTSELLSGTLAAIPATCTVGAAIYQATDEPITTQIYACTATNTWTRGAYTQATTAPVTCSVGQVFFDTDATAGSNWFGCTATNTWTLLSGGAASSSGLTTTRTSATVLGISAGTGRIGTVVTAYSAATGTISGSTASSTAYVYVDSAGTLTLGHNGAATITCSGCTTVTSVTAFPAGSQPLATATYTSNAWDVSGITLKLPDTSRSVLTAGTCIVVTENAGGDQSLAVSCDPFTFTRLASVSNCADSAGAAACGSAPAGAVVVDAAATSTVVSTTAITANSQILVFWDSSLGTRLGVTCNTTIIPYKVSARTAATSFTITLDSGPVTNPACLNYLIVN